MDAASTIRLTWRSAFGEPSGSLMAGRCSPVEWCPERASGLRSGRVEGHFSCTTRQFPTSGDGIVGNMFFVYIMNCADGALHVGIALYRSAGWIPIYVYWYISR